MVPKINLLPWRNDLCGKKERNFKKMLLIVFGIIGLILSLWHLLLLRQINITAKQTDHLQQLLYSNQQHLQEKNTVEQQKAQQPSSKIIGLEKQQAGLIQVFENLHRGISANLRLTQLTIKSGNTKLFGKTDSIFAITQLVKALNQTKHCSIALVEKINRQDDEYDFVLSLYCGG